MKQNSVKVIGIKDESRKDAHLSYLEKEDGLKVVLSSDFDDWTNFDSWESISVQQWIFSRALEVSEVRKLILNATVVNIII